MAQQECKCGRHFLDLGTVRKLCHDCRVAARKDNLCTACGEQPIYADRCCHSCWTLIQEEQRERDELAIPRSRAPSFAKPRTPDHMELTNETKFGKWHG
jgi:hypothetical protein